MTRLPAPPADVPVVNDPFQCAPKFRAAVDRVLSAMRARGHTPLVFETLRTDARQSYLYGFGRHYDDGRGVVTHSETALDTWHHYGLAMDIICALRQWDAPDAFWRDLMTIATREGLTSGADWNRNGSTADERFLDRPHIQWGPPMRRSPSPSAASLLASGGLPAVWRAVGAV